MKKYQGCQPDVFKFGLLFDEKTAWSDDPNIWAWSNFHIFWMFKGFYAQIC